MLQRRGETHLTRESLASDARGEQRQQYFDDDGAAEGVLAREENPTHSAAAELPFDAIRITESRLQVRAEIRSGKHRFSRCGGAWVLEWTPEKAFPVSGSLAGQDGSQLGGELGRPRRTV